MTSRRRVNRRSVLQAVGGATMVSVPALALGSRASATSADLHGGVAEVIHRKGGRLHVRFLEGGRRTVVEATDFGDVEPAEGDLVAVMRATPSDKSLKAHPYWEVKSDGTVTGYRDRSLLTQINHSS